MFPEPILLHFTRQQLYCYKLALSGKDDQTKKKGSEKDVILIMEMLVQHHVSAQCNNFQSKEQLSNQFMVGSVL